MASWDHRPCGHCGDPLPPRGFKWRHVPRLGGKRRRVHEDCAELIDQQSTLDETTTASGERVEAHRLLDPAEGSIPF